MDDSVQVRCVRCKSNFRDKARRLQDGYSRQCPSCESVIFFNEDSPDKNIKQALLQAKQLRKQLRENAGALRGGAKPFAFNRSD